MSQLKTIRRTKEVVATTISDKFGIAGPEMSAGSTINSEIFDRLGAAIGLDLVNLPTTYRKFEALLVHFGETYDAHKDSSEHSPTGGSTISSHGWRKLARACGASDSYFIFNYADADVSEKYKDVLGETYGFSDSVTGKNPVLEAGMGAKVVFYNTSNSRLTPQMAFIGTAVVTAVVSSSEGKHRLTLGNYKAFPNPVPKSQAVIDGWNNQHGMAEIDQFTFNQLEKMGQTKMTEINLRDNADQFEVDIRPDAASLRIYRGMNFTPHYALGEFIDNSITSALKNIDLLKAYKDDYELIIQIRFDESKNEIILTDNAAGIAREDIGRALKAGNSRNDNEIGLSKYGVGMKAAAFWFGAVLELDTFPIGEDKGWHVEIDISGEDAVPAIVKVEAIEHRGAPGTILKVKNLWNPLPKAREMKLIERYLPSIYRSFISPVQGAEGVVPTRILFHDKKLEYRGPQLLEAPFWASQDGPAVGASSKIWKQHVDVQLADNIKISGWVAILNTMSRDLSGFTLFYRGKAISGAVPVADAASVDGASDDQRRSYKPKRIFKQEGSKMDQSLVGEFDVTDIGKTITTDKPTWTPEMQERFAIEVEKQISMGDESLIKMAANYRRRPGNTSPQKKASIEDSDEEVERRAQSGLSGKVTHGVPEGISAGPQTEIDDGDIEGKPLKLKLADDEGHEHQFELRLVQARESEFFTIRNASPESHEITVNTAHRLLDGIDTTDTDVRKVLQWVTLAFGVADVFSDTDDSAIIRRKFNNTFELLGNISSDNDSQAGEI